MARGQPVEFSRRQEQCPQWSIRDHVRVPRLAGHEGHLADDVTTREPTDEMLAVRSANHRVRGAVEQDQQAVGVIPLPDERLTGGEGALLRRLKNVPERALME